MDNFKARLTIESHVNILRHTEFGGAALICGIIRKSGLLYVGFPRVRLLAGDRFNEESLRTMRVLAVSDQVVESLYSPAVRDIARGVELVLSCGDLPSAYLEYLVSMLDVPLMYVMGNHGGAGGEKEFPEGCQNLDNRVVRFKGLMIAGLQGSIRYNAEGTYQYGENEMRAKIARLLPAMYGNKLGHGRYLDVLITHAPPFGIHDGRDLAHRGFESFLWLIDHYRPQYLIHGHQHVYDRRTVTESIRGRTLVVNAFGYKILNVNPE